MILGNYGCNNKINQSTFAFIVASIFDVRYVNSIPDKSGHLS